MAEATSDRSHVREVERAMMKPNEPLSRPNAANLCVFGSMVTLFALFLILSPLAHKTPDSGVAGVLGMPGWLMGVLLLVFGGSLIWAGVRRLRRP